MSSRREAPEPWASAMLDRGMVHAGKPSMRQLALKADVVVETVRRMIFGEADSDIETVRAIAGALEVDVATVSRWTGAARELAEPWSPPVEADRLSPRQRRALEELIRAMTESEATSDGPPIATAPHVEAIVDAPERKRVRATPAAKKARANNGHPDGP